MEKKKIRFVKSDKPWTRGKMVIKYRGITYGENNLFTIATTVITLMIVLPIVFFMTLNSPGANYSSWSGTFLSARSFSDSWVISARTVNGHSTRTLRLNADNLNTLHVNNINEEGEVFLIISQVVDTVAGTGEIEKEINVSGEFIEYIDMQEFKPGNVRVRLIFNRARGVDTTISWS